MLILVPELEDELDPSRSGSKLVLEAEELLALSLLALLSESPLELEVLLPLPLLLESELAELLLLLEAELEES